MNIELILMIVWLVIATPILCRAFYRLGKKHGREDEAHRQKYGIN